MATITLTIPNDKLDRVKAGMLEVYPNDEMIPDPDWVDPGDGSERPQVNAYTDNEWLKERVRRFVVHTVKRGESAVAQRAAKAALEEVDSNVS